jgi:hypothetical protein
MKIQKIPLSILRKVGCMTSQSYGIFSAKESNEVTDQCTIEALCENEEFTLSSSGNLLKAIRYS